MPKIEVMNGNKAAAVGAALSRPGVIAAYPITPQTPLVEYLTQFCADGKLSSTMSEVESELSAMSVLTGASLAGSRTFTATSSQGLSLMYEPYFRASTLRLPVVMAIANREMISPQTLWGGPQDALTVRDAGWLQVYVEDNQEILDMIIQAFRIAEDKRVLLPINICYDGFYLSHMAEKVIIPDQEDVDVFLPPYRPDHILLDPEKPMAVDPLTNGYLLTEYRYKHMQAQQNALSVIEEVDREFANKFGRSHGGLVEAYRCDDCDAILVTMGSLTGAAREAVDAARDEGKNIGLLKIRTVRPFPKDKVFELLKDVKAFGVVDRNVSFGWNTGIIYQEVRASLYQNDTVIPSVPFIGGLGGEDLTMEHFLFAIDRIYKAAASGTCSPATLWLNKEV
jgi:phenylglyoxylate dehydrogenase alpha subunit